MAFKHCSKDAEGLLERRTRGQPEEELDAPLPEQAEKDLKRSFNVRYGWLELDATEFGTPALIGRARREFLKREITVYPLDRVQAGGGDRGHQADPLK